MNSTCFRLALAFALLLIAAATTSPGRHVDRQCLATENSATAAVGFRQQNFHLRVVEFETYNVLATEHLMVNAHFGVGMQDGNAPAIDAVGLLAGNVELLARCSNDSLVVSVNGPTRVIGTSQHASGSPAFSADPDGRTATLEFHGFLVTLAYETSATAAYISLRVEWDGSETAVPNAVGLLAQTLDSTFDGNDYDVAAYAIASGDIFGSDFPAWDALASKLYLSTEHGTTALVASIGTAPTHPSCGCCDSLAVNYDSAARYCSDTCEYTQPDIAAVQVSYAGGNCSTVSVADDLAEFFVVVSDAVEIPVSLIDILTTKCVSDDDSAGALDILFKLHTVNERANVDVLQTFAENSRTIDFGGFREVQRRLVALPVFHPARRERTFCGVEADMCLAGGADICGRENGCISIGDDEYECVCIASHGYEKGNSRYRCVETATVPAVDSTVEQMQVLELPSPQETWTDCGDACAAAGIVVISASHSEPLRGIVTPGATIFTSLPVVANDSSHAVSAERNEIQQQQDEDTFATDDIVEAVNDELPAVTTDLFDGAWTAVVVVETNECGTYAEGEVAHLLTVQYSLPNGEADVVELQVWRNANAVRFRSRLFNVVMDLPRDDLAVISASVAGTYVSLRVNDMVDRVYLPDGMDFEGRSVDGVWIGVDAEDGSSGRSPSAMWGLGAGQRNGAIVLYGEALPDAQTTSVVSALSGIYGGYESKYTVTQCNA